MVLIVENINNKKKKKGNNQSYNQIYRKFVTHSFKLLDYDFLKSPIYPKA